MRHLASPRIRPPVARLAPLILLAFLGACSSLAPGGAETKPPAAVPQAILQPQKAPLPAAAPPPAPAALPKPAVPPPPAGPLQAALILPLSGPSAGIGNALLNAAQLALFELSDGGFTLLPLDSRGSADGAVAAAAQAVSRHADIVIGPLFSAETRAAAVPLKAAGIPVLAFTTDRAAAGGGLFVLGFRPGPQALRVAAFARAAGKTRLALLAPNDDYGRLVAQTLTNAPEIVLAGLQYYPPDGSDFATAIKRLVKSDPKRPGDPGFDALLLPDQGQRLHDLAAALNEAGMGPDKVKYLGTMLWDEPKTAADPLLAGGWYAAPPAGARPDFEARYMKAFGVRPPRLASLGYDATAIAAVLARKRPHDLSLGALTNPVGFSGIDGLFRLTADGLADRGYAVLEITPGAPAREIDPAPQQFPVN